MIAKRLLLLQVILLGGLSSLWLLPKQPLRPEPGVNMELPFMVGEWVGEDEPVSDKERSVLGHETRFSRKSYIDSRGNRIFVSIVLAGNDMNTSIHRPERCLPAQGYTIVDSQVAKVDLPNGAPITTTRLHNRQQLPLSNGEQLTAYSLNYYWFVGDRETTHSHVERNFMDVRDRLLKGYNQPWAFVTVIARINKGIQRFGLSEEETDEMIREFLAQLVPVIQKPTVVNH